MSLDSSMSLNIPSSLLVNAAPHSGREESHSTTHSVSMFPREKRIEFILFYIKWKEKEEKLGLNVPTVQFISNFFCSLSKRSL